MARAEIPSDLHTAEAETPNLVRPALNFWALAGAAILAVAVFVAYFPSLNGGFIWDDEILLTKNRLVSATDGLGRIWCTTQPVDYWPLVNSTFWMEWRLWEMHPAGYHATNLILHIAGALLIWAIMRKLSMPGAFLAALIFALHPVNVESVAWIAQRKNTLSMLFFLLSILWYVKAEMRMAIEDSSPGRSHGGPWERGNKPSVVRHPLPILSSFILHPSSFHFWYWLSFAAFVCAMLGKGSAAVLPVLLLGIIWWKRRLTKRDFLRTAPFFAVAAALTLVNMWFQTHGAGPIRSAGIVERLLGAGALVWFYLYKAILPFDLAFIYPQWHIDAGDLLWWAPLLAAVVVTAMLWLYRKTWGRPLFFAWGFFCVSLLPVLGLIDVYFMKYSLAADHYQYAAIIGVIALASAIWNVWNRRLRVGAHWTTTLIAVAAVGVLGLLTWRQSGLYCNELTLYQAALENNPGCWMTHDNMGVALCDAGRINEAIRQYAQALELKPDDPETRCNMGNALVLAGRNDEAIEHCQEAIRLKPKFPEAYNDLGNALVQTGRLEDGIKQYELAIRLNPEYVNARYNLGNALIRAGRFAEAADQFQQALRLKPDFAEIHNNLGSIFEKKGQIREAIEQYRQAVNLKPDFADARFNLGNAFEEVEEHQKAAEQYEQVLALKPDDPEAHYNLGNVLVALGWPEKAIEHYQEALRLRPEFIDVYSNMALIYASLHRSSQAIGAAQKALDLARSQGLSEQAGQIENWLNSYRAGLSDEPKEPAGGETPGASSGAKP